MRGRWNEANVAMRLATTPVIGPNGEQACIFALRAGIGLHGEGVVAGDLAEFFRQIRDNLRVAERLIRRREGMDLGEIPAR